MALTASTVREYPQGDTNELPIAAATIVYEGAAVGDNGSGYARGLVSGDPFRGFAYETVNNSAGAAGDKRTRVRRTGLVQLAVSGLVITDVGRTVYASDDGTFVLTGAGSPIGVVDRFVSAGVGIVAFAAADQRVGGVITVPVQLASITGAGDVVTNLTVGFHGRIKAVRFVVTVPVTTAAKAASLNVEIGTTNVTGGVVALTSANCTPLGAVVDGSAVTAANVVKPGDTLSVEAATVTAFAEGAGVLVIEWER